MKYTYFINKHENLDTCCCLLKDLVSYNDAKLTKIMKIYVSNSVYKGKNSFRQHASYTNRINI